MADTTAKILAKGTSATGITEELARKLHDHLGKTLVAIVEITSDARTENSDGSQKVSLKLGMVEPALDNDTADHLRDLARSLHAIRKDDDQQLAIDQSLEPKVSDVLAAGAKHKAHAFTPAPEDAAICDVCGHGEATKVHAAAALGATADDDTDDEPDEAA